MLKVGERSVRDTRAVLHQGTPEIVAAVEQGRIPVSRAAEIVRRPLEEQHEAAQTTMSAVRNTELTQEPPAAVKRTAALASTAPVAVMRSPLRKHERDPWRLTRAARARD